MVVIGANGSGKTRFGSYVENNNRDVHRITAQKTLEMPESIYTKSKEAALNNFLYGNVYDKNRPIEWLESTGRLNSRYQNKQNTGLLSDYEQLMTLLFTEEFEASIQIKNQANSGIQPQPIVSKLDHVIAIWNELLPHREIYISANTVNVIPKAENPARFYGFGTYKGPEMSDGERVIFYLIGEAVCAPNESILVIDEPELHIHKSILKKLFDLIEKIRPDVLFLYLTHDIDFAVSRSESKKIWLRGYYGHDQWQYEFIDPSDSIPEQIYYEILGSRKDILFIEGDKTSIDYSLYSVLFPDRTITPIGSCQKVIESTKSFNDSNGFHHLNATGIIDRDRRSDDEVTARERNNINVLKLAEVENLFLLEDIVRIVAERMAQNPDDVFSHIKEKVIFVFSQDLEKLLTEYTISNFKIKITNSIDSTKNWNELSTGLNSIFDINIYQQIYDQYKQVFSDIINRKDYLSILKYANIKKILIRSDFAIKCNISNSEEAVRNLIIHIIKSGSPEGERIKQAMTSMIM